MASARRKGIATISSEFEGAELGDERRSKRLLSIVEPLEAQPGGSFPQALGSDAELEAFYRFIGNRSFTAASVLGPHVSRTLERARGAGRVVVVHDTTSVEYKSPAPREGLGFTTAAKRQGFLAHVSLVLAADGLPLGVAHVETLTRSGKKTRARKKKNKVIREDLGRESLRWVRGIEAVESARDERFEAIHVSDAEGDFFEFLAAAQSQGRSFVIRAGQLDRLVGAGGETVGLREAISAVRPRAHRVVEISGRNHDKRKRPRETQKKHPSRDARAARLAIGATRVTLKKTKYTDVDTPPFEVTVVRVWEPKAPDGQPPVEWVLFTSEDVSTTPKLKAVVDIYRLRWTIEEFFKVLKTGCVLEKRQVESYAALCKVFALFVPIAYRLLLFRGLQRRMPHAKVSTILSPTELLLLAHAPATRGLPAPKTIDDGVRQLARLGGHIKNNGDPGWQSIGRGYEKLLLLRVGWELGRKSAERSDQ
jgi:hypothetical protein